MNKKRNEKVFPLLEPIHTIQPDTLTGIVFGDDPEIDASDFPLVFIDADATIMPITLFKGYGEIGSDAFVSNCFLSKATIKDGVKIIDSRIFTAVIEEGSVVIDSTIEGSKFGPGCYVNGSIIMESVFGKEVVVCGNSHINCSRIYDEVVLGPQVVVDNAKIENFSYLETGVKIIGHKGKEQAIVIIKSKVYIGAGAWIIGPALIDHNCYIDNNVILDPGKNSIGIFIPPFSWVRKSNNAEGYEILEKRACYLLDGLWYVSKAEPIKIKELVDVKRKIRLLEEEVAKKRIDIKEILQEPNHLTQNQPPVSTLLEKNGLEKFRNFLQSIIETLVN
ncbi:MAG: hypothetical protein ACPLKV_01190 [Minisyncoccia bacterium]